MPQTVLPELNELHRLIELGGEHLRPQVMCKVHMGSHEFDVLSVTLGNPSPAAPAIGFFGGVHGLERIGAEVVLAYLGSLVQRLKWDSMLHQQLQHVRMVFMPLVNPGGLWQGTRANPNGVDLMRNAPLDATEPVPFLLGGQRLSATLPWYRGPKDAPMQEESYALCQVVEQELLTSPFSAAIDCHSGFGVQDRIWFPSRTPASPSRTWQRSTPCTASSIRRTCTIPTSSSRKACSTSRMATCGTTSTCWAARARPSASSCR
ncbi:MAG: M14 family zinc carboxypeptidase [Aquabacterium sp.]